ncbi:DEAD/DEAH box helicase, partial [Streptomyces sp. uw30]|uniref:DEAD/DEAH box helicase n=1 Tax=Streptomyces sp. uw30 TaxID=1828179 RepID=UPI0021C735E9
MVSTPHQALAGFSPATRGWFTGAFSAPTAAQAGAWQAINEGADVLVVAPTGSGKTLAAFLAALDQRRGGPRGPGRVTPVRGLRPPARGPRGPP